MERCIPADGSALVLAYVTILEHAMRGQPMSTALDRAVRVVEHAVAHPGALAHRSHVRLRILRPCLEGLHAAPTAHKKNRRPDAPTLPNGGATARRPG